MNSKFQSVACSFCLGEPVQIVSLNEKSGFKFEKQAAYAILCSPDVANRKVVPVSVAGEFRQGKSFLLNCLIHLLEQNQKDALSNSEWLMEDNGILKGFSWRGGCKRETTGIWMWSKPFIIKLASGEEIYNLFAKISEDRLEILQYFMEFARCAMEKASSVAFQHLIFLVRDWPHSHEHEYGFRGGAQYLCEVLQITNGQKKENETVRKSLRHSFEKITCLLTPRPGDVVATSDKFSGNLADIPKDFKVHVACLCACLFSAQGATVKSVNGRPVNGEQLFDIFESCVNVFQSGQLPEAKTAVQGLAEQTNSAAVRRAMTFYTEKMKDACKGDAPIEETDFNNAHQNFSLEAKQVFEQNPKLGDEEISRRYAVDLETEIVKLRKTFFENNVLKWEKKRKEEELAAAKQREENERRMKEEALTKAAEEYRQRVYQEQLASYRRQQFEQAEEQRRQTQARYEAEQKQRQYQEQLAAQRQTDFEEEERKRIKAEEDAEQWRSAASSNRNQPPKGDGGVAGAAIGGAILGPVGAGIGWAIGKFL